jgi:hypothetical protein
VVIPSGSAVLSTGGPITITGSGYGAGFNAVDIAGHVGLKSGVNAGASTSDITLVGDKFALTGSVASTGVLTIKPYTTGATIGLGSGAGTVALASSWFTGTSVIKDGFSRITLGAADAGNLTVGGVNSFVDSVVLQSGGNITLNSGSTITDSQSAGYIALAATGNFINNAGANAISTTDAGANDRWIVYSNTPSANTFGGLDSANLAVWSSTYSSLAPASVGSGNRYVFASAPTALNIIATTTNATQTYGTPVDLSSNLLLSSSDPVGSVYRTTSASYVLSDVYSALPLVTSLGNTNLASVSAGPYAITASGGVVRAGFVVSYSNLGMLTITPKMITPSGTFTGTKAYDGSTAITGTGTGITFSGVINGDTVTVASVTGNFADRHVGTGKPFTAISATFGGADAANYTINPAWTAAGTGEITKQRPPTGR